MTSSSWQSDSDLLAELRIALAEAAEVPEPMIRSAKALYAWRTVDEDLELLTLMFDSEQRESELVRSESVEPARSLIFQGGEVGLEAEIDGQLIVGQIFPVQVATVTTVTPNGTSVSVTTDELGRFTIPRPPSGPMRLRCTNQSSAVVTQWLTL